jgi:hypothetical protein
MPATGLADDPEQRPEQRIEAAAAHFDRGQRLYNDGRYEEAVRAFTEANRIAPHRAAWFNIGRCHENLGRPGAALAAYEQALALAGDADAGWRADLETRMARLRRRPTRVLVSSVPLGATVTVDGRAAPEGEPTPTVLRLIPGEHLLLLRKEGYQLAARRVVLAPGREVKVDVALERLPLADANAKCPPQQRCRCPEGKLVDTRRLHVHLTGFGSMGLTTDQTVASGPGVQLHGSYRGVVFGGHFVALLAAEQAITGKDLDGKLYNRARLNRMLSQFEGGWMWPFRNFYLYGTAGIGWFVDRVVFASSEDDFVRERFAFAWSVGGGIEVMATWWLSMTAVARFGLGHGDRADTDDPAKSEQATHHFPFGVLWAGLTLHL